MVAARVVFDKRDGQGPLEEGEQLGPSSVFQAFFTLLLDQLIHSCAILNQEEPYLITYNCVCKGAPHLKSG